MSGFHSLGNGCSRRPAPVPHFFVEIDGFGRGNRDQLDVGEPLPHGILFDRAHQGTSSPNSLFTRADDIDIQTLLPRPDFTQSKASAFSSGHISENKDESLTIIILMWTEEPHDGIPPKIARIIRIDLKIPKIFTLPRTFPQSIR